MVNVDPKPNSRLVRMKLFLSGDDSQGGLRTYLIRGTAGVFALQIVATGLGFVTNILLARFLGATEYGVYSYVFAWVGLLTVLSMFGFGRLLVREIASYLTKYHFSLVNGILRWIGIRSFVISVIVAIIFSFAIWLLKENYNLQTYSAFLLAMIALPPLTLTTLIDNAMQGLKRVVLSRVPQVLIRTPLFILLLVIVYYINPQSLNASTAVGLSLIAIIVAFVVGFWLLIKILPPQVLSTPPEFQQRIWLQSALPLLLAAGMFELNARIPVIMLGTLAGAKEAGIFSAASLITSLIGFILISANATLGPVISSLYATEDIQRLQKIITRSARLTFILAFAITLAIFLFRYWILLIFGEEFQDAGSALIILGIGQLFNVASGSIGLILVMTGHEKNTLIAIGASTVVSILLNSVMIPRWGVDGAAFATTISIIVWNIILVTQGYRRLGIDSSILGILSTNRDSQI